MVLSWFTCFRSGSRQPVLPPSRPAGRRGAGGRGIKKSFRPVVLALEDRTVPSGMGGFSHFSPPGPATHLQVIVPEDVQSGKTVSVVVEAEDASNRVATGFTDTVSLTSIDTTATGASSYGATLAHLPLSYTFTAKDHGVHVFQVNLTTVGSESVTASDTTSTSVTLGSATTTVNPAPTLTKLIVVTPETAAVGVATPVTVEAVDASGHLLRNFTGTVSLITTDTMATGLPSSYTFLASDHGVHSFQVTFGNADAPSTPTTVTATDGLVTGSASITVDPAMTVTHFAIYAEGPAVSGTATQVVVKALNASNQVVTGYGGTVSLSSSDTTATASATSGGTASPLASFTYMFSSTDAGVHTFYVTFGTTGKQSLTVSDTTAGVSSSANVNVLATAPRHHGWWWF